MDKFLNLSNTNIGDIMFNNYEIKTIKNEEVLYLYINNNVEFANLKNKDKKTTITSSINDFLHKNKISFNGKKVLLIASGLLVGACLLTSSEIKSKSNLDYNYTTNIIAINEVLDKNLTPEKVVEDLNKKEEQIENNKENAPIIKNESIPNSSSSNKTPIKKPSTNITNSSTSSTTSASNTTNNITTSKPSTSVKPTEPTDSNNNPSTPIISNKQMVTVQRSNGTILNIELEEYLIGVVAAEMPASFSTEALKAQAIAARTYALKQIENNKTLTDTVATQVYKDNNQLKKIWGNSFNTYYSKVKNAVNATSGLVMYYNNTLINAFYHSTSNGFTEDATAVFGAYPYLKSVESTVDKNVSSYLKTITMSYETISNKLKVPITSLSNIKIERNNSNHVSKIIIDNNTYDGVKFRTILGLRSTDFDITLNENNVIITTRGYGHGVGMSQYGAHEYAKLGWNYSKILKHYYTGITIKKY